MLCSNQQMIAQSLAFLVDEPPVLVDWTPWNHTFGGNHDFGLILYNGGTLYIDDGKPTPAGTEESMRNLREISPTFYLNVPKGFEGLVRHLKREARAAGAVLRPRADAVLRRSRAVAARVGRPRQPRDGDLRRDHPEDGRVRLDRNRAVRDDLPPGLREAGVSGCRARASRSSSPRSTARWRRASVART